MELIRNNLSLVVAFFVVVVCLGVYGFLEKGGNAAKKDLSAVTDKVVSTSSLSTEKEDKMSESTTEKVEQPEEKKPETKKVEVLNDTCLNENSTDFDCYEVYYRLLVSQKGTKAAFADLRKRYENNAYVIAQCHQLTHVIGRVVALKYNDVGKAYQEGDTFCWSGFYHGVMENIVERVGANKLLAKLDSICAGVPGKDKYSFEYFNCVHGLGHGLMLISDNELPKSLKDCDSLTGSWEKSSCYGGVFMENVMVDHRGGEAKYLDPNRLLYPCDSVNEKYQRDCYLMQTSYMMKVTHSDFGKIFTECAGAGIYSDTCWQSLGRDASGSTVSNVTRTKEICEMGNGFEQQSNCIIGAVKDFVSYYHAEEKALELCNSLAEDIKQVCLQTEKEYYVSFK